MPAASGASGPMTVRPTRFSFAKAISRGKSSCGMGTFVASAAVPALPGATNTSSTRLDCASFQARACSRPPPPTTRTFMRMIRRTPRRWPDRRGHEPCAILGLTVVRRKPAARPVRAAVWKWPRAAEEIAVAEIPMNAKCGRSCVSRQGIRGDGAKHCGKRRAIDAPNCGIPPNARELLESAVGVCCTENHGPCGPPLFHRYHLAPEGWAPGFVCSPEPRGARKSGSSPREMQVRVVDKVLVAVKNLVAVAS